jgi:hypothetical protein
MIRSVAALAAILLSTSAVHAAEGMWTPFQLPDIAKQMSAAGLKLNPKQLANLKQPPLSAVIWLGNCTASFVSPQGLAVTNHHCAQGSIQFNSRPDRDLLKNGFVAATLKDELPAAPGSRIQVLEDLRDVTADIIGGLPDDMSPRRRFQVIEDKTKALVAACEQQKGRRCEVRPYYGSKQFVLQTMLEIQDVRLVYAPAEGVGFFGGDVDNWMWPRHTGDFSYYRAYVAPDGSPAAFSDKNVPFKPKAWLRLAKQGVKENDFVMVAGYPGQTNRWRTLGETEFTFGTTMPTRQQQFVDYIKTIEKAAEGNRDAGIRYASLLAGLNNSEKNWRGQMDGAKAIDLMGDKRKADEGLKRWVNADAARQARFAPAIQQLEALVEEENDAQRANLLAGNLNRGQLLAAARNLYRWAKEQEKPNDQREPGFQERDRARFTQGLQLLDRRFEPSVDRAVFTQALGLHAQAPADKQFQAVTRLFAGQDQATVLDRLYKSTKLTDAAERMAWIGKSAKDFEASSDPFIQLAVALYPEDMAREEATKTRAGRFQRLRPIYMTAMIDWATSEGRAIYPDANSTLRISYGKVTGRTLPNGTQQPAFTFAREIPAKASGEFPFAAPQKQLDLIKSGVAKPDLVVNTLSTLDITGGNSGSPVMNARGELVGLAFDGTIEGIISDWAFDENLSRTISVDSRYMVHIMDHVDRAHRILREMGVKPTAK